MSRGRRTVAPSDGQTVMVLGMLSERPGSQLDLIAEAGLEQIGPATLFDPAAERAAAETCTRAVCIDARHRH